jgi:hypothetical protein
MSDPLPQLLDAKAYVYVFRHSQGTKVGMTRQSPEQRRDDLQKAAGIPIEIVAVFPMPNKQRALIVEAWALQRLRRHRTFGEWHSCSTEHVVEITTWAARSAPALSPATTAALSEHWQRQQDAHIRGQVSA